MLSTIPRSTVRGELRLSPSIQDTHQQLRDILKDHSHSGLTNLLEESHPKILFHRLFALAGREELRNQEELAKKIYRVLTTVKEVPLSIAQQSVQRLEVLNEGGPAGLWLERWSRKVLHEASSTKLLLEMTAGGMGCRLGRLAGGFLARAAAVGSISRWLLPRSAALFAETAAFSGAALALTHPVPENPWSAYGEIFRSSGVMFSSLRLARAVLGGNSMLRASAAAYLGLVGNHAIQQHWLGWEQPQDFSVMTRQSLAEFVTFTLGGHFSHATMGRLLRPLEDSLNLATMLAERPRLPWSLQVLQTTNGITGPATIFSNEFFSKSIGPKDPTIPPGGRGGTQVMPDQDPLAHAKTEENITPVPETVVRKTEGEAKADPALAGTVMAPEEITPAPPGVRGAPRTPTPPSAVSKPFETPPPPALPRDLMPTLDAPPESQQSLRMTLPPASHTEIGVGSRLGESFKGEPRYETVNLLGEGGQGLVYKVIDHKLEKADAVIKVLRGQPTPEIIRRQEREYQLGIHLKTKTDKIAAVYDLIEVGGIRIPVSVFVEGKTLDVILNRILRGDEGASKTYSVKKRAGIFVRIAEAVEELHNLSVMHRDLKPANIMVSEKGQVVLLDLGIGKVFTEVEKDSQRMSMMPPSLEGASRKNLTQAGHFFGTPGYWAPEMLQADSYITTNPRSYDVFALGSILYEMITGVPAFVRYEKGDPVKGEPALVPARTPDGGYDVNIISVLQLDKSMKPPAFKDVVAQALDADALELEAVVRKATAPQPKDRYQSAEELSRAVQLAPTRVEKRRLDGMRQEMEVARQQIQEDSPNYRQVEISEEMWEKWNRPVRALQRLHESWHEGAQNLVERILTTMKGEEWTEGKRMIAQISWERLLELGHRINPEVREALMQKIRDNDVENGKITGMKEALEGKIPIQFKVKDYMTGADLTEGVLVRVFPFEKELDAQGMETGNYRRGNFIYHGPIKNGRIPVDLGEGFYIFRVYSKGYAVSPMTLQINLEDVRRGISEGKQLDLEVEMVPKALVPKGMTVIQGMKVYIGDDPNLMRLSPFEINSQPQHKVKIGPLLVGHRPVLVSEYRKFLEAKLKKIQEEVNGDPKLRKGQRYKKIKERIKEEIDPLIPGDPLNKKAAVGLKTRLSSALGKIKKKPDAKEEEDRFYWKVITVMEGKIKVWKLNDPKKPEDHHGTSIDGRKPVEAITPLAGMEYLKWLSQDQKEIIQGRNFRLGQIYELEGVALGGLPLTYPFGGRFDISKVACRSCFPDNQKNRTMRVGRHPVTGITGDRSPLGPIDMIGNIREFSATEAEKDAIFVFGGSVSIYNGTSFKPSNRPPMLNYAKYDSFGFRKFLDFPPRPESAKTTE